MARNRKKAEKPQPLSGRRPGNAVDPETCAALIVMCQRALKWLTITIMTSILLVVAMTTVSTGSFVQVVGKGLYFVVDGAAVTSLAVWSVRLRLQKRLGTGDLQATGLLKRL